MIGICPHCKIKLKEPPFGKRETNEVMLVLAYRRLIENGVKLKSIVENGFCEICKATLDDIKKQKSLIKVGH